MFKVKLKIGELYSLNLLDVNNEAEIIDMSFDDCITHKRFMDLGLTRGINLKIKKKSPIGGLISFEIRDYELALRESDLKKIIVRLKK
jgi:ferrous iron transport protein A